jgi:hypothetical protein
MSRCIARFLSSTAAVAVMAAVLVGGPVLADTAPKTAKKESSSFGALKSPEATEAREQAEAWLKSVGKADAAGQARLKAIWATDRPLVDKVSDTLAFGNADAAKLLAEARNPNGPAPVAVPALLKDAKQSAFLRSNLALAYAKALTGRKVYEEALETFAVVKPEDVIDPSAYFFHRAVCEHALMLRDQADSSLDRLLVDVTDAPERYRMVGALMRFDMVTWQDKDLGWIARKMGNIQRRLDLKRGGKQTQKIQKEVLVRLDEMIKEKENQQKQQGNGPPNGGNCPGGGQGAPNGPPQGNNPSSPAGDFGLPTGQKDGIVDPKKVKELADNWGTLPEKERAKAMVELTRGLDPKYRDAIETYIKEASRRSDPTNK